MTDSSDAAGAVHRPVVKVCAISSAEEGRVAVAAGAQALGLVPAMPGRPGVISEGLIAEILDRVKAAGFRWSRFAGCWWAKQSAETLAAANRLTTVLYDGIQALQNGIASEAFG